MAEITSIFKITMPKITQLSPSVLYFKYYIHICIYTYMCTDTCFAVPQLISLHVAWNNLDECNQIHVLYTHVIVSDKCMWDGIGNQHMIQKASWMSPILPRSTSHDAQYE